MEKDTSLDIRVIYSLALWRMRLSVQSGKFLSISARSEEADEEFSHVSPYARSFKAP